MTLAEKTQKLREYLSGRQMAYVQVFNPESVFARRVLGDLARFCRANESTFHTDPRMHAVLEGRREVFLRICKHTKMDPSTFLKLYGVDE